MGIFFQYLGVDIFVQTNIQIEEFAASSIFPIKQNLSKQ